jgi:hypothetical protein
MRLPTCIEALAGLTCLAASACAGGAQGETPRGWDSTTNFDGAAYVTAATSGVSPADGALGINSQMDMTPGDVLVSIVEYRHPRRPAGFTRISRPPKVDLSEVRFSEGTPHAMFLEAYAEHGRYFQFGGAFGRERPTSAQAALADRVLASLRVSRVPAGG